MELQIAALCDSAVDYQGKLCLLGAFDTIMAASLPAVHPQCSVALRLVFRKEEEGSHAVVLSFMNEDGQPIVPPIRTVMEVLLPGDCYFSSRNMVLNLQGLKFEAAGQYSIELAIDGRGITSIPLQVVSVEPAPRGS